jgi:aspartyl-tRNA(Asn)/glutamyl-tRNA(Gln) amidotransferase subunit C
MSAELTRRDVARIAALAQLELDDAELDLFGGQLASILDYARQVQEIDTAGVPPTSSVAATDDAERPDVVTASMDRDAALANAPDGAPHVGLFRVPRVMG